VTAPVLLAGDWYAHAACAQPRCGISSTAWDADADPAQHRAALAVCRRCPVTAQCLAAAVASQDEGIRGGELLSRGKTGVRPLTRLCQRCEDPFAAGAGRRYCDDCRAPQRLPRQPPVCGTVAAHRAHLRRGEPACPSCLAASSRYSQDAKRRRREQRAVGR
jgi:Transcription factor WhiB